MGVLDERTSSGCRATSSFANRCIDSTSAVAQRVSIRMLRPSVHPSFWSSFRKAATLACPSASFSAYAISTPIRRTRSACCARAASGHAAAVPPSSVMNSRRLTSSIGLPPTCRVVPLTQSVCRMLSLLQGGWKVLGLDLNRSESNRVCCQSPPVLPPPNNSTTVGRQEAAALRDVDPAYDRLGS